MQAEAEAVGCQQLFQRLSRPRGGQENRARTRLGARIRARCLSPAALQRAAAPPCGRPGPGLGQLALQAADAGVAPSCWNLSLCPCGDPGGSGRSPTFPPSSLQAPCLRVRPSCWDFLPSPEGQPRTPKSRGEDRWDTAPAGTLRCTLTSSGAQRGPRATAMRKTARPHSGLPASAGSKS